MDISIRTIRDPGDKARERVVLQAEKNLDIGWYILLATRISKDGTTLGGLVPFCFWFPNREVKSGDIIVAYSKTGQSKRKDNSSGNVSHFFYWGLEDAIWGSDSLRPVLMATSEWKSLANIEPTSEEQLASSER
jgi:hypothetical protein